MAHDRHAQILVLPATSTRLGHAQARHIVQTIIADDVGDDTDRPAPSADESIFPWRIQNRYYEANVRFRISNTTLTAPQPGPSTNHHVRARRARAARDTATSDTSRSTEEADLDTQVRDVFAALELGPAPSQVAGLNRSNTSGPAALDEEHIRALREDVAGMQAVMILVDRDQPLSQHRKLLSIIETPLTAEGRDSDPPVLLSGFDLAISLVVALPSPLQDTSAPTTLASLSGADDVEALYSGAGWEYIDLAKGLDGHLEDDESDGDEQESLAGEEEKQGIERIREALMTHTWPNLTRNQDRPSRRPDTQVTASDEDGGLGSQQHALSTLRTQLDAIDSVGTAEPTEKDEELARAFLARIQAAQSTGLGGGDATTPFLLAADEGTAAPRSAADLYADLERFLQNEDGQWPSGGETSANGRASHRSDTQSEAAWAVDSDANARATGGAAFDDDFAEFVQAGLSTTNVHHNGAAIAFDDDELAFLGDEDDAVLLRALAASQDAGNGGRSDDVQIDFASTLSAVMAQAERVRAIADHEQRREEAARVALALLDQ